MRQKKKIALIVTPLTGRGGIIRRLSLWGPNLSKHYDLVLFCYCLNPDVVRTLEAKNYDVVNLKELDRLGRLTIISAVKAIVRQIRIHKPDVLFSMFLWADFISVLAQKMSSSRIPHIVHIAGDPVPIYKKSVLQKMYKTIVCFTLKKVDRIFSVSHFDANKMVNEYKIPYDLIQVVPIGIDILDRRTKQKTNSLIRFGIVSRLDAVKNIDVVINVLSKIKKKKEIGFTLHVYGEGESDRQLKIQSSELEMDKEIVFHGWISNPTEAFDRIDCLILFSHTEGTPRSIMEAALRGVPTIAKDVGGVSEIILDGKTGFLVHTETQLEERLLATLKDPASLIEYGKQADKFIKSRHSIEVETAKIHQSISEIAL